MQSSKITLLNFEWFEEDCDDCEEIVTKDQTRVANPGARRGAKETFCTRVESVIAVATRTCKCVNLRLWQLKRETPRKRTHDKYMLREVWLKLVHCTEYHIT
jgi:hypothetical protein